MLLAIDTSAGTSVAIVDDAARVLAERSVTDTMRHAEVIGDLIRDVLADATLTASAVTAVAAGMGPGPFTGLRIGIAAARVFAFGINRPLLPVVSHDALAFAHYRSGATGPVLVVTDARRREVYFSRYEGADALGLPLRTAGPGLAKPDAVPHSEGAHRVDSAVLSAAALGQVAALTRAAGLPAPADDALYLRSPDVTVPAGPKRVS